MVFYACVAIFTTEHEGIRGFFLSNGMENERKVNCRSRITNYTLASFIPWVATFSNGFIYKNVFLDEILFVGVNNREFRILRFEYFVIQDFGNFEG